MDPMVRKLTAAQLLLMAAPALISLWAVLWGSWIGLALSAAAVFALAAVLPLCRRRESLWVFWMTFAAALPPNIGLMVCVLRRQAERDALLLTKLVRCAMLLMLLVSIEELAACLLARLLWRRQYKALLIRFD